jgi:hypothetical protein
MGTHVPPEKINLIGYTANTEEYASYKLVIKPSGFFDDQIYGTAASLPKQPLQQWEEVPVLFGEDLTETINGTLVIHADIIAGTYFLISRYEEMVRSKIRDTHNRFPGKESLPYKAGFIDRPIIEEWGALLRSKMRATGIEINEPPQKINKVFLTHDVDQLAHYRNIRGMMGGVLRGVKRPKEGKKALKSYFGGLIFDPWYTFPYLYKLDNELKHVLGGERCEVITFLRSNSGKKKEDKPIANLLHPDYKTLIRYSKRKKVSIGLHTSYEAGCNPTLIDEEKKRLDRFAKVDTKCNRNHYLNNREPEDFEHLISCGILDDFSMGYADMAGFRLGTCRPVKWINPIKKELTELTLHSLIIMDCTLNEKKYMYMNAHDAYEYCVQLINCVEKFNGDIILLWHNTMVEKDTQLYHRKLYRDIIKFLEKK